MSWNKDAAVSYLRSHALGHSHNECAKFTRRAIIAGGITLERTHDAKDYGPKLCVQDLKRFLLVQRCLAEMWL
jgi:hypothetical protein